MARSAAHAARLPRRRGRGRSRRASRRRSARRGSGLVRIWARRVVALALVGAALAAAYQLWLRDLGVVAVRDVEVVGASSADGAEITAALTEAAQGMTTLHVREDELRAAVRDYPTVGSVSADPRFPNGLTIEVAERRPVAIVAMNGRDLPVAGDGTVLPGLSTAALDLPALEVRVEPDAASRLEGGPLEQARVLGATPKPLRPMVEGSGEDSEGVVVELFGGITLRFGDAGDADAKWAAAARILADGELAGLTYIDLRAPEHPAVGGAAPAPGAA
ncbi:MAG: cell division protein FtsQ/DivIB [Solirubrobacterales bacterium]